MLSKAQHILLSRAIEESPVRNVDNFGQNIIGQIVVPKAPRPLQFESLLECSHIIRRERDPRVVQILDQALTIPITYKGKRSARETTHVPDFLVEWRDRLTIEEVKPLKRIQEDRRFAEKRRQAELFAAQFEAEYLVFTEADQGEQTLSSNLEFLSCFRFIPDHLHELEERLVQTVRQSPGLTVLNLAGIATPFTLYQTLPCIWHLLYAGRLCANLLSDEIRIGSEYTLQLYPSSYSRIDSGSYQLPLKPGVV